MTKAERSLIIRKMASLGTPQMQRNGTTLIPTSHGLTMQGAYSYALDLLAYFNYDGHIMSVGTASQLFVTHNPSLLKLDKEAVEGIYSLL
jgi:hypothetical protein